MLILYVDLEWCRRWYVLARVACRANKLIGVDTCLATFRGAIRTLNSTVSDPSLCLEGVAQFCVLWSAVGFPLSVRDPISASGDPRPLIWSDLLLYYVCIILALLLLFLLPVCLALRPAGLDDVVFPLIFASLLSSLILRRTGGAR